MTDINHSNRDLDRFLTGTVINVRTRDCKIKRCYVLRQWSYNCFRLADSHRKAPPEGIIYECRMSGTSFGGGTISMLTSTNIQPMDCVVVKPQPGEAPQFIVVEMVRECGTEIAIRGCRFPTLGKIELSAQPGEMRFLVMPNAIVKRWDELELWVDRARRWLKDQGGGSWPLFGSIIAAPPKRKYRL